MGYARHVLGLIGILSILGIGCFADACPFCEGEASPTLVLQFEEAKIVLFGHFENAKRVNTGGFVEGESDFIVEETFKSHDMVKGKKSITLPRYMPDPKLKFLIFGEPYKGRIDVYKGMQIADDSEMRKYVEGAIKLKGKPQGERLRFAFDFLNSPESEISMDAYREFQRADYKDYKDMAKELNPKIIAGWLKDPKTPSYRYGLYASLLGHCGKDDEAKLLLKMIEDPEIRKGSGLFGLMAAYTMLEPTKGWTLLKDTVKDKEKRFLLRYSGLVTMRFLHDYRADLVNKEQAAARTEIVKGVSLILGVADMADFAVEDLRKWQRWEYCDQVLGLFGKKGYEAPHVRKAILRYALQCPNPKAAAFVKEQTAAHAEWVADTRELLELETTIPVKSPPNK